MKHNVKNSAELQQAVNDLQATIDRQEVKMKDQYEQVKENLKPKNVLKNTYSHIAETPELQRTLINTVIGLAIGYGFKKARDLMKEESLDRLAKNLLSNTLNKLEENNPQGLMSKSIKMLRKSTPADSKLYQFIGYQD